MIFNNFKKINNDRKFKIFKMFKNIKIATKNESGKSDKCVDIVRTADDNAGEGL